MNYEEVKQEIPDMSVSVFNTLKNGGATIQEMKILYSPDPEIQRQRNQKITEMMQTFVGLSRSTIENELIQNDWNEDLTIIPLLGLYEEHQRKQQEKIQVQELTKKRLDLINDEFTEEDFKQKLEENDGDHEATIIQLLEIVEQRQKQKRKDQELVNRQYENEKAIATLQQRFPDMKKEDILEILKKNNWDLVTAGKEILKISEQKKISVLVRLYPASSKLEIEEALEAANWEFAEACNVLIKKKPQVSSDPKPSPLTTRNKLEESLRIRGDNLVKQIQIIQACSTKPSYETLAESQVKRELEARLRNTPALQPGQQQANEPHSEAMLPFSRISTVSEEPVKQQSPQSPQLLPLPNSFESAKDSNENVTLTLDQTVVDINNEITVTWKINDEKYNPTKDWIALYNVTEDNLQKYHSYQWTASSEKQGFLKFTSPQQYGKYRFVYLKNGSYRILAESPIVSVGPVYEISAKYQQEDFTGTRHILVNFKKFSGNEHPNAWVGMYKPGSSKSQMQEYQWLSSATNSTLKFSVPKGGNWEFKLFPERNYIGPYVEVAECSVTIPGNDRITFTHNGAQSTIEYDIQTLDPVTDRVWIGVFFVESTTCNDYRRSKNITTAKGKYVIKTPIHGGSYHARLYGNGSAEVIATSNSVTLPDTSK
jgi:hypothetical protein